VVEQGEYGGFQGFPILKGRGLANRGRPQFFPWEIVKKEQRSKSVFAFCISADYREKPTDNIPFKGREA
jgi:hypothetical protein